MLDHLSMMLVYLVVCCGAIVLLSKAPCPAQFLALVLIATGFLAMGIARGMAAADMIGLVELDGSWRYIARPAREVMQIGVMLYIARLWYNEKVGKTTWPKFSVRSPKQQG